MLALLGFYKCLPRPLQLLALVVAICFAVAIVVFSLSVVSHLLVGVHTHSGVQHHHQ